MSDEFKALVARARNRINDAPLETERLIDDLADCVEALSIPSDGQFVFLDEYPGKGAPLRKVTKDEALKLFHERLTAQADEIANLKAANVVFISEHPGKNYPTSQVTKDEAIAMLQARVTAQADEIERLRGAVGFYAKDYNWRSSTMYMCGHSGKSSAEIDRGDKARAALKAAQHSRPRRR